MAILTWQNNVGSLGNYPAGSTLSLQFTAMSDDPSSIVTYKLLSGNLPTGTKLHPIQISLSGLLSGQLDTVYKQETYYFTIRAYDQYGNIRDRTFNITIYVSNAPSFTYVPGLLISLYDSIWVNYQVNYKNPVSTNVINITHTSGTLPPGLRVTSDGKIQGYPIAPTLSSGTPIDKNYTFTLFLQSKLGNDTQTYSIQIINQRIKYSTKPRLPVICNSRPIEIPNQSDPYYGFYLTESNTIPTLKANEYFTFKVIGHDFDNDLIKYTFYKLPPGLVGDEATGWITGYPYMGSQGIGNYTFQVSASKINNPTITSFPETFKLKIVNNVVEDIVWNTPEDLGTIYNHVISELSVSATSVYNLKYIVVEGDLPANLNVESSGSISGRVAFQPTSELLQENSEIDYTFTVQAYAEFNPQIKSFKTFKLTVKQYFTDPVENVYFKISPSYYGRVVLRTLLTDTTLIPNEYLYRPDDPYYGKSSDVKIVNAYGIPAESLSMYLSAISKNFYYRNIQLGEIKTAIARDDDGNIMYEVVYVDIVDSISGSYSELEIQWPRQIGLNLGPWTINNTDIYTSYDFNNTYYTSLTPGSVNVLYPATLDNMRTRLIETLGQDTDSKLLPRWMTTQQKNGDTLGFIKCWIICYTLPDKSDIVKSNIENNWAYSMSDIGCTLDRFYVDKSSTYNYDVNLEIPAWTELPSEVPNYTNPERNDLVVLFPRKTILPK